MGEEPTTNVADDTIIDNNENETLNDPTDGNEHTEITITEAQVSLNVHSLKKNNKDDM